MKTLGLENVNVVFMTDDGQTIDQIKMEWILEDMGIVNEHGDLIETSIRDKQEMISCIVDSMIEEMKDYYEMAIKSVNMGKVGIPKRLMEGK